MSPRSDHRDILRFWKFVDKTATNGCWVWLGGKTRYGQGNFWTNGTNVLASRFSYELHHNVKLKPEIWGELVLHSCDNPACVNPDHLRIGTQNENIKDRDIKGRQSRGISHYKNEGLLTEETVRDMIKDYREGMSCSDIVKRYGIPYYRVWDIVTRRTWIHLNA